MLKFRVAKRFNFLPRRVQEDRVHQVHVRLRSVPIRLSGVKEKSESKFLFDITLFWTLFMKYDMYVY
jgi:hypothetical protein